VGERKGKQTSNTMQITTATSRREGEWGEVCLESSKERERGREKEVFDDEEGIYICKSS
jgi:hypothetical protein